jgi:hypothetical protein
LESNHAVRKLDIKKRFTEKQIIGFLRKPSAGPRWGVDRAK